MHCSASDSRSCRRCPRRRAAGSSGSCRAATRRSSFSIHRAAIASPGRSTPRSTRSSTRWRGTATWRSCSSIGAAGGATSTTSSSERPRASGREPLVVVDEMRSGARDATANRRFRRRLAAGALPVSARKRTGLEALLDAIVARLPISPPLYGADDLTDRPVRFLCAELIREAAMGLLADELPHAIAVEVVSFEEATGKRVTRIRADLLDRARVPEADRGRAGRAEDQADRDPRPQGDRGPRRRAGPPRALREGRSRSGRRAPAGCRSSGTTEPSAPETRSLRRRPDPVDVSWQTGRCSGSCGPSPKSVSAPGSRPGPCGTTRRSGSCPGSAAGRGDAGSSVPTSSSAWVSSTA